MFYVPRDNINIASVCASAQVGTGSVERMVHFVSAQRASQSGVLTRQHNYNQNQKCIYSIHTKV